MKKIILLLTVLISFISYSQTNGITYQAVILNPSEQQLPGTNQANMPLANATICLQFSILDQNSSIEYQETISILTDEFGMVNLIIGSGFQTGGYANNFQGILWNNTAKNLKVDLNTNGSCSNFEEISNQPFTFVPFALYALNPENTILIENNLLAIADLQEELDATQTGAGLNLDGTYKANGTANYIATASALNDADDKLDAQAKVNADGIATNATSIITNATTATNAIAAVQTDVNNNEDASIAADDVLQSNIDNINTGAANIQSELDATQTGAGLNLDGAYTANSSANYIATANALNDADDKLDAQVKVNAAGIVTNATTATNAIAAVQTDVNNNEAASIAADDVLQSNIDNINTGAANIQSELDATQTGAGLNADGTYNVNATSNYIATASALNDADDKLDAQVKVNADAITTNATAITNNETVTTNALVLKEDASNKSMDATLGSNSDIKFPTEKAVKTYVDANIASGTATNVSGIVAIANGGTGLATQNFVDITTDQTIAGDKTFTGAVKATNLTGNNTGDQDLSSLATNDAIALLLARIVALEKEIGPAVGDLRAGGVVFWVDPNNNTKGLVCALQDQGTGIQWYNGVYGTTGATGTAIGTGAANTTAIINEQGATPTNYAAGLARAYAGGGYTDWFLPSKDELNQMYEKKGKLRYATGFIPFSDSYWSSTEYDPSFAWNQFFVIGNQYNVNKSYPLNVRAVRAF
jgi:hypothetical protein